MKLISVKPSKVKDKKLVATFCKCKDGKNKCEDKDKVHINFGSATSQTYAEGASEEKKEAYLARHKVNENWNEINPASLSRYILWSAKSIEQGVKNFMKKFKC